MVAEIRCMSGMLFADGVDGSQGVLLPLQDCLSPGISHGWPPARVDRSQLLLGAVSSWCQEKTSAHLGRCRQQLLAPQVTRSGGDGGGGSGEQTGRSRWRQTPWEHHSYGRRCHLRLHRLWVAWRRPATRCHRCPATGSLSLRLKCRFTNVTGHRSGRLKILIHQSTYDGSIHTYIHTYTYIV